MKKGNRSKGLILSIFLLISTILSVWVIPLPIAKAAPTYSWSTFTIAASGDDVTTLANSTWSNYTSNGNNLWAHSDEYTTISWLRFEGLGDITDAGGVIDQIILSLYSGDDVGADYTGESASGGYVSIACPLYVWDRELSEANLLLFDMNPIASFDGDELSPSGAWYNKTISTNDPRNWYSWSSTFNDVFTCYVGGFMQYAPDHTYYRGFTSQDEGNPAKLYVKYHIGEGYEEVLDEWDLSEARLNQSWNNYNIWTINLGNTGYEDFDDTDIYTEEDASGILSTEADGRRVVFLNADGDETFYFDRINFVSAPLNYTVQFKLNVASITYTSGRFPIYLFEIQGGGGSVQVVLYLISSSKFQMGVVYDDGSPALYPITYQFTEGGALWYKMEWDHLSDDKVRQYAWISEPPDWGANWDYFEDHTIEVAFRDATYDSADFCVDGLTGVHDADGYIDYVRLIPGDPTNYNDTYVVTAPNGTVLTPTPYADLDDALDFAEEWDEDYGPIYAVSIANIDASEWVFEGNKRYDFTVEYINVNLTDIDQVGVGFTDETDDFHSVWYDRDANTLTVTSPEDCISGWLSSISQTSTNVTAIFQIMFNSPVPDSYSVSTYARIVDTSDSGWVTPQWGEAGASGSTYLFNIYNLGGLSGMTATGTAGRMTGGDVFEIYAADTRTNIAGTQYFDVRDTPLSWYNVLTNEDLLINEMPMEWDFNIPRRAEATTIRLTNNLPANRTGRAYVNSGTDSMAYVSYPFSMRVLSDPYLTGDYQVGAEMELERAITSDDGILWVQAYLMNPNTTQTTGAFRLRDGSRLTAGTKILADVQFAGNSSWVSYNSTASAWLFYGNYTANTWYNVTLCVNLTGAVYDVFIDDELKFTDMPYRNVGATSALIVEFTQFVNPYGGASDFLDLYVDNVRQWTDFDADYGGEAKANTLFKQLQHWSMDFDFFIENGKEYAQGPSATPSLSTDDYSDHGFIELGWDVMLNETWVNDYLVARVNITDGRISGKNDWIEFNVTWYSQGSYVKNDLLYGLFEGYSQFPGNAKDTAGFHWDIWVNRANASTVIGARINTEYFGMSDNSVWWAIWSSKWQPMRTEVSDSSIFVDLENAELELQSAKDILFVRSWVKVHRTSDSTFAYKILNIDGLDFLVAIDTMSGVDTPPVRETKVPDVISGFLGSALGSIFSAALKRLGNALAGFGIGFFTLSIDFIDNIFAALGFPALVSTIFGWLDSLFSSVPSLLSYGITLIGSMFNLINVSATGILTNITSVLTIWVGMYDTMGDFFSGVYTPGLNLWNDLGVSSFIQIVAIMYPFYLVLLGTDQGLQAVIDQVNSILNLGSFFLNFILNVGGFFMGLLDALIGAIRG